MRVCRVSVCTCTCCGLLIRYLIQGWLLKVLATCNKCVRGVHCWGCRCQMPGMRAKIAVAAMLRACRAMACAALLWLRLGELSYYCLLKHKSLPNAACKQSNICYNDYIAIIESYAAHGHDSQPVRCTCTYSTILFSFFVVWLQQTLQDG